jgi:uncharacterized protein YbjT (DUF2867 family)
MKLDKVLLLGGSGFIGRHVAAELARRGIKTTVPSRQTSAPRAPSSAWRAATTPSST